MFGRDYRYNSKSSYSRRYDSYNTKAIWPYVLAILVLLLFMFILGKEIQSIIKNRMIYAADLHVISQNDLIKGNIEKIYPAQQRIFTVEKETGGCYLDRSLSPAAPVVWKPVGKEPIFFDAVSPDGKQFLLFKGQDISLYNSDSQETRLIKNGRLGSDPDKRNYYSSANWSADGSTIYLVHHIFTNDNAPKMQIEKIDVASGEIAVIIEGDHPFVAKDQSFMVFEKDKQIWRFDLQTKQASQLAEGSYPALSPDNIYVACIQTKPASYSDNETSTSDINDLYIFSLGDPQNYKKVSANYMTDAGKPAYTYSYPVWDTDSSTLYVTRETAENIYPKQIKRYKLGKSELKGPDLVNLWLEARLAQDNETLYKYFPGYTESATESIDQQYSGFSLEDKGMENAGLYAVIKNQINTGGRYRLITEKLHLDNSLQGYQIKNVTVKDTTEYIPKSDGIYQNNSSGSEEKLADDPGAVLVGRDAGNERLIYCRPGNTDYEIVLLNEASGKSKSMDSFISNQAELQDMSLSKNGQVMVITYAWEGSIRTIVYNLKELQPVFTPFLVNIDRMFWSGNNVIVYSLDHNLVLRWEYNPGLGTISL